MPKIQILVDANSVGYTRHYGGDKSFDAQGKECQAVKGFIEHVIGLKHKYPGANIIILWDGDSWRKEAFSEYKANRKTDLSQFDPSAPMDAKTKKAYRAALKMHSEREAYKGQTGTIRKALRFLGLPQVMAANYEADDLGALFCDRYLRNGDTVVLNTSDKDWLQLVQSRVVWKSPREGTEPVSCMNFTQRTGFKNAAAFLEGKILAGDKSDNIPGVPGFGPARVTHFFNAFGSFDEFFGLGAEFVTNAWSHVAGRVPPKCVYDLHQSGPNTEVLALNRRLMDLRSNERPKIQGFQINKSEGVDLQAFYDLCRTIDASNILRNFNEITGIF